jgi:uncharacterized protein
MKLTKPHHAAPHDAAAAKAIKPVICYPIDNLKQTDLAAYQASRAGWKKTSSVLVPPREARCFDVPAGHFFRIISVEGPQVGDLNLWNAADHANAFIRARRAHCTAHICRRVIACGPIFRFCGRSPQSPRTH